MTRARDIADRKVADSDSLVFGAGSDLTITHDASDSLITDSGTGNLQIRADDFYVMKQDGSEVMIRADTDSFVKLYYDNAEKLATTSVGIGVNQLFGLSDTDTGIALGANGADIMQFYTGNSERVRIQAAGGISFNGDSAAANALDDYEEGTFTPEIRIGGSTSGLTQSSQVGQYTKIGRMVTLTGRVAISNKGSNTGAMTIAGMPFASQNTTNLESIGAVELNNMSSGTDNLSSLTNNNVICRISPNVLTIEMRRTMIGANDITNVQMSDSTVVSFTITYFT
jgi:hypothetical protein